MLVNGKAPSNSEQSKRQAVGNLLSEKISSNFFQSLEDDSQPKVLKRKVPTIGALSTSRSSHISGRQKDSINIRPYPVQTTQTTPPSSAGSSTSSVSSASNRHSAGALLQTVLQQQESEEQDTFDKEQALLDVVVANHTQDNLPPSVTSPLETLDINNQPKEEISSWVKLDGMESDLVKDFDNNLSGLGLELGANAYNMSEVLNLPIFKQESLLGSSQGLPPLQYMLCAQTSPATKVYEETLTYLNQGQSYEIKLKKLRDIDELGGSKLIKSQLRVVFHDRRLQYTEYQQFQRWKFNRPGDRLLNIDIPMSVGVLQPHEHPEQLNLVEFVWDIDKEASVCVQVHCISTEFTARKHGGEKGVPFRIQIDTYALDSNGNAGRYIHSASCQIKVFKPKGADRKLKTDKDKMEKRTAQDKLKYQPSYDSTLLSECMPSTVVTEQFEDRASQNRTMEQISEMVSDYPIVSTNNLNNASSHSERRPKTSGSYLAIESPSSSISLTAGSTPSRSYSLPSGPSLPSPLPFDALIPSATVPQTQEWLQRNRFSGFAKTFGSFSGVDLLSLSRDDITQICGHAEGIRLFNCLRAKAVQPRLTLYLTPVSQENESNISIYKAFYLERTTVGELLEAVGRCLFEEFDTSSQPRISRILYQPRCSNIHVLVTDEVVTQMKDESSFTVAILKNESSGTYQVILKPQS